MGKYEAKIIVEKERTKRAKIWENNIQHVTKLAFVIMLGIVLVASLLIADWR